MTKMEELLKQQQDIVAAIAAEFKRGVDEAAKGIADAQYNLAVLYHHGQGIPRNFPQAIRYYKLAAEQSYAEAQFNLGLMCEKGQGASEDYAQALIWYKLAAGHKHIGAQLNLGALFEQGKGLK